MKWAYYNDIDPFVCAWVRELIKEGVIPDGEVDERSIRDVRADDLRGFKQVHLFCGVAGWAYALKCAGWNESDECWSASCPCQPFSTAGKRQGTNDERHLWPEVIRLVRERRPRVLFGEQVASALGSNSGKSKNQPSWWDIVQRDLEGEDYACGMAVLGAHSVGAPHRRQRLYFVAHAERSERRPCGVFGRHKANETVGSGTPAQFTGDCEAGFLADSPDLRRLERRNAETVALQGECAERSGEHAEAGHAGELSGRFEGLCGVGGESVDNSPSPRRNAKIGEPESETRNEARLRGLECGRADDGMDDSQGTRRGILDSANIRPSDASLNPPANTGNSVDDRCRPDTFWADALWLPCRDNKLRPVERAIEPSPEQIFNGLSDDLGLVRDASGDYFFSPLIEKAKNRVGRLRGYGNAICVPQAVAFINSYLEAMR